MSVMESKEHSYSVQVRWIGNLGEGTSGYRSYSRNHEISVEGKPTIAGSSDPTFRGDPVRYNPEELLVASLSTCHMLWYLHLCSRAGIPIVDYRDDAVGIMTQTSDGGGHFKEVVLRPEVTIEKGDAATADALHKEAHRLCFISRSVNFRVRCQPTIRPSRQQVDD